MSCKSIIISDLYVQEIYDTYKFNFVGTEQRLFLTI